MTVHSFNVDVAKDLWINAAVVLYNLAYLQTQRESQGGDDFYHEGKWWVRHSYDSLSQHHSYLSVPQIKRIMFKLEELGHVTKSYYGKNPWDRTTYWSVAPVFLHSTKSSDASDGIVPSHSTKSSDVQHDNNTITKGRFSPPTVEQVKAYCEERKNSISPNDFVDHYETNGWMRGKTKIKCWKACVRTWEKHSTTKPTTRSFL